MMGVLKDVFLTQIAKTYGSSDNFDVIVNVDKGTKQLRGLHVDILGPVVVGRSPSSDIVVDEPFVSATHARFSLQGPALVLEDLGSTNGTMVNGHLIGQPVTLRDGDEVQIGDTVMRVSRR